MGFLGPFGRYAAVSTVGFCVTATVACKHLWSPPDAGMDEDGGTMDGAAMEAAAVSLGDIMTALAASRLVIGVSGRSVQCGSGCQ